MTGDLIDTKYFSRRKISLAKLANYEVDLGARSQSPRTAFTRESGFFYVFQELQMSLLRHLDAKPRSSKHSDLIVWTLKDGNMPYGILVKDSDDLAKPVPWWVIKPLLRWQQSGIESAVIPASGAMFSMAAHIFEQQTVSVGVSLQLVCGSLHSEWHLRPIELSRRTRFPVGSVFLSVV